MNNVIRVGISEWGIYIASSEDYTRWMEIITLHNTQLNRVETDLINKFLVLLFRGKKYLVFPTSYGRDATAKFLKERKGVGDIILWPHQKPVGWHECEDIIWKSTTAGELPPLNLLKILFDSTHKD